VNLKRSLVLVVVVLAVILGLDRTGVLGPMREVLSFAITPMQLGWYRFEQGVGDRMGVISHVGTLGEDNLRVRAENDRLKVEAALMKEVVQENRILKAQLETSQTAPYKLLEVQTLGYVPDVGTKELLLSGGSRSGVKVGQVVVSGEVILGKIISTTVDKSTLRLLTDPQTKVLVGTIVGVRGILVGQFQSSLKMTKVLPEDQLNVNDQVIATGEEDWPKGLVVGEITKVSRTEGELFQEAVVGALVSYDSLQTVFVIVGNK
jgi:rod shape-determining protein MreC